MAGRCSNLSTVCHHRPADVRVCRGEAPWTILRSLPLMSTAMEFAFNRPGHLGMMTPTGFDPR